MPATRLFVPRMSLADPNTNPAYAPNEGREAVDYNPDNAVVSASLSYHQFIWDIDPFSGSGAARFSCNWAGMFVTRPSVFADTGKQMHVRTADNPTYTSETLRAVKGFGDNTTEQPILIGTFAATTDRYWMLELQQGGSLFLRMGLWFAGTYFDIEARWNNDTPDTTGFFNRTQEIGGGRHYSRSGTSGGVKRWVRRFEDISGVDMQALRDAHALAHGSHVPFIMSDNPDNAAEGYLVRFDESADRSGLGEIRIASDLWAVDVPLVELPWLREGVIH